MSGVQRHNRGCLRRRNVDLARPSDCASPGCKRRAGRRAMSGRRPNPGRTTVPNALRSTWERDAPRHARGQVGATSRRGQLPDKQTHGRGRESHRRNAFRMSAIPRIFPNIFPTRPARYSRACSETQKAVDRILSRISIRGRPSAILRNRCPPGHRRVPRVQFDVGELQTGSRTHVRPTPSVPGRERPTPSVLSERACRNGTGGGRVAS